MPATCVWPASSAATPCALAMDWMSGSIPFFANVPSSAAIQNGRKSAIGLLYEIVSFTARIDEPRPCLHDLGRALGIIGSVQGQGARLDDYEARPWVRVPAKAPAGRDLVLQDPDIGFTLGVDPGLPGARIRDGLRVD